MTERGSAKAWLLAFAAAAGVGLGALIGIGCAISANACPFGGNPSEGVLDGRTLWVQNCARCHGIGGAGAGRVPSLVAGERATLDREALEARIARGKPLAGMPAFKRFLSEGQIGAVAAYVIELREREAGPEPGPDGS